MIISQQSLSHGLEKGGAVSFASRRLSEGRVCIHPAQFDARHFARRQIIRSVDRANGLSLHCFAHELPMQNVTHAPVVHPNILRSTASSTGSNNASKWKQGRGNSLQRRGFFIQEQGRND